MMRANLITLKDLTVAYNGHPAIHHVDGCFAPGSLTAVAGPNGAGKSTLLKTIAGLIKPQSGKLLLSGITHESIAYLPQTPEIDRSFPITVADTVLLGAWRRTGIFKGVDRKTAADAHEALAAVGLEGFEKRPVNSLSAGQFQRVLFARLMLQDASVLLLDEPFSAIDSSTKRDLLQLIVEKWHRAGRTIIAVLHDFSDVAAHFPETLLLAREVIAWGPTSAVLTSGNLARAFSMGEAWDEEAPICERSESPLESRVA